MDEIYKILKALFQSDISSYKIHKDIGISTNTINSVRRGERQIKNLTLETAEKLVQ